MDGLGGGGGSLGGPQDSRKRNMERRRETSRFAARDRRAKESDIYDDLKEVVPVVEEPTITHVDRIALLRVAATVCRYRKNVGNALTAAPASAALLRRSFQRETQGESPWSEESITECLDGFILIADSDGVILYVTESVSLFLGLTQTDFAGRHLRDFIAPEDYKDYLSCTQELTATEKDLEMSQQCVLRIKTVISPRGRNLNLKSAILKPVAFNIRVLPSAAGHCHCLQAITVPAGQGTVSSSANTINRQQGETPSDTFMTRHTCDMKLTYVSEQLHAILKSDSRSLMGASYYDLVHPADAERLRASVAELLQKGHTRTPYYRLLTSPGTVAWIMTEASTVPHTTRGQKGMYIIGIHHLLGQQTEEECDRGACKGIAAGLAVRIKQEPDDREYLGRQPEILECVDFAPMLEDAGEYQPVPVKATRRGGAFGNLTNGSAFNTDDNNAAPPRKQSYEEVLQWLFRDNPELGDEEARERGEEREQGGEEEKWRRCGGIGGGGRRATYAVQPVSATAPSDPFAGPSYRRASHGAADGGGRGVIVVGAGGHIGRGVIGGGGGMLQGSSVQPQLQSSYGGRQHTSVHSPQNALSSSFSRACDLSSPPHAAGRGGATTPATRPHSPIGAAQIDRNLRPEELCGPAFEDGRLGTALSQTSAFPLSFGAGRGDERRYAASQDVLASLPPPGFTAAEPFYTAPRRATRVNTSLVSSGYGSTATSTACSPSSSSSTASSTPAQQLQQQGVHAVALPPPSSASLSHHHTTSSIRSSRAHAAVCEGSLSGSTTTSRTAFRDDCYDYAPSYAPYIDPAFDIPIGAGAFPKDLASLLDLPPWNEAEGLPNFNGIDSDFSNGSGDVPATKRAPDQGSLFDDWPGWLDGRM